MFCERCHAELQPQERVADDQWTQWDVASRGRLSLCADALASGHLAALERVLKQPSSQWLRQEGRPEFAEQMNTYWKLLAERREEETRLGGPGSLIDLDHPLTKDMQRLGISLG